MSITPAKERSATSAAPQPAQRRRASARFWTCLVVLLLAAVGLKGASQLLGAHFRKEPLPLKKPLALLVDSPRFGPRYSLDRELMGTLPLKVSLCPLAFPLIAGGERFRR